MKTSTLKKSMLVVFLVCFAMIFSSSLYAQTGLIWNDEFDGTSLNLSKWIILDEADGGDAWYQPANVSVGGGLLTIANREELRADGKHWTGGHIDSTYHPLYKYLEARVKISAANTSIWPAWWTVGWVNNTWKWPPEFDIFEFMGTAGQETYPGQWYHYYTPEGWHTWAGKDATVNEADWHTYGVSWALAGPTFYLDGYKTSTPPGAAVTEAALIKITSSPNAYSRTAGCALSNLQVDWVRVYDNPPTLGSPPPTDGTISMNKPAFASTNSTYAVNVNDNRLDTGWDSVHGVDPQWLYIDLEGTKTITQVVIYWETAAALAYQIQTSANASSWTTVWSTTTGDGGTDTINLNVSGAYIRMYGTARTTGYGYHIFEMKVYGSGGGGNTPPTVSITAPANGATYTAPASVTINANAADPGGSVSKVDFYQGATLLGTDTSSPYSYTWTNVAAGSYTLTAKATDNLGAATTSGPVGITVNGGGGGGTLLSQGKTATASTVAGGNTAAMAVDGNMGTRWESASADPQWIYVDLGATATITQIILEWETAAASAYQIQTAAAAAGPWTTISNVTGGNGGNDTLAVSGSGRYVRMYGTTRTTGWGYSLWEFKVYGTAGGGGNTPPTVSITSPANGATFTAPASVTINATASDPGGSVANVAFYQGATLLSTDTTSPYSYTWGSVAAGTYSLTARATDNLGATTTSAAIGITVNAAGNTPPTVSITSPANGATFTAPASVTINATASDPGGSVANVAFYQGATLLSTDTTSPYSYTWGSVAAGSYSLTARATDNLGAVTTSAAIGITVNGGGGGTAPTYQAVGTVRSGTGALTVSWPTHQANDVALLVVETANQAVTLSTPAGFAAVTSSPQGTGTAAATTATRLTVFWKRATTSAEASAVVADAGDHQIARIVTFRGCITSGNPWDVTAGNTASASTAVTIPGATTTVANTLVAVLVANATDTTSSRTSAWANSALTGITERMDNNTTSGNGGGFGVATGVKATAGAIGNTTATLATSSVQGRMCIALKPAAGGGGGATLLSQGMPVTASSVIAGSAAANAVDGSMATKWGSVWDVDPQWIYVDLGATKTITQVILDWDSQYGRSYQIQTSAAAGGPWADIYSTTTGDGGNDTLTVSGSGRYVRMNGTVRGIGYGYELLEFKVYGN